MGPPTDPYASFPGMSTFIVTAPTWGVHYPVPQLLAIPLCCAQILWMVLLAAPSSDHLGALILEKLLVESQCLNCVAFKSGPILSSQLPHPLNNLAGPALLSTVRQGLQSITQSWKFLCLSPKEAFVQELDELVVGCVATSLGRHTYLPYRVSPCYPGRKSSFPCPIGLQAPSQKRLFGSALLSAKYPALLSSVTHGERECYVKLGHLKCGTLKSYSLRSGKSACPTPACLVGTTLNGQLFKSVFMHPEVSTLLSLATPNMNLRFTPLRKLELETLTDT